MPECNCSNLKTILLPKWDFSAKVLFARAGFVSDLLPGWDQCLPCSSCLLCSVQCPVSRPLYLNLHVTALRLFSNCRLLCKVQVAGIYQHRLLQSTTRTYPQFNLPPSRDPNDRPLWHCPAGRGSITTTILGKGC